MRVRLPVSGRLFTLLSFQSRGLIHRPLAWLHSALTLVKFENVVFTDEEGYMGESEAKDKGLPPKKLSGTEFRRLMRVRASFEPSPSNQHASHTRMLYWAQHCPCPLCDCRARLAGINRLLYMCALFQAGEPVPEWFAFKCVIDVLQGKNA